MIPQPTEPPTRILLRGLDLYGHHGVPDEERVVGHRYRLDVELDVRETASLTDDVGGTVDYSALARTVEDAFRSQRDRTLERLARRVGEAVLRGHPRVLRVLVRAVKPLPPMPFTVAEAGVEIVLEPNPDEGGRNP
jgi:7,8-dihydroneopterin aldolase/epimerase/oxygenase